MQIPASSDAHQIWLASASQHGSGYWVKNTQASYRSLVLAETEIGLAQSLPFQQPQSYVHCPRSAWIDYPLDESRRQLSGSWLRLARLAGYGISPALIQLLRSTGLLRAVIIDNYLVSTNLYPVHFAGQIAQISHKLSQTESHPLLIRNICGEVDQQLMANLLDTGWLLIPSRLVYLCKTDDSKLKTHNHVRQDAKLLLPSRLQADQLEIIDASQISKTDLPRLLELYKQLFLDKYSLLNPEFTLAFLEFSYFSGFLDLYALRHQHHYLGVIGLYKRPGNNWITTPFLGYQLQANQEFALYRRLMALLLQQAQLTQLNLHYSSGAGQFKQMRGGQAALEYCAVYSAHLPMPTRLAISSWAGLLKKAVPFILARSKT